MTPHVLGEIRRWREATPRPRRGRSAEKRLKYGLAMASAGGALDVAP